jgi:hypothetical protein
MKKIIALLMISLMLIPNVYAEIPEKVITAEGVAAGSDLKAHDEALNRALRRAVEQGVGTVIDSESMTQNYQLLEDKVYAQVKGYVKSYNIVSDNNGADGIYRIKIEAVVAIASLTKDLKALNIIREKKNNPRIMILLQEFVDGLEQPSELVQAEMEKEFLAKSFPLVDKAQFQMVKERDVALSYTNPEKAAVLGREFGAEVVIVGQATCNLTETSTPYGVQVFAYTADIAAKAIKTDTAAIIATDTISATERGSGRMPTANKALGSAGKQLAGKMISGIVEKWRSEVFNTVSVQIVVENMQAEDREILKNDLSAIRGVQGVNERSFNKSIVVMDITVDGAIWNGFEKRLTELPTIKLQLVAKTENKIELKKLAIIQKPQFQSGTGQ